MSKKTIKLKNLSAAMAEVLADLAATVPRVVRLASDQLPIKAEQRAEAQYDSKLGRVSGNLFRSIAQLKRRRGVDMELGLQNKMEYAQYQEHGTRHITAKHFLEDPIREVANEMTADLILGGIGFDG